LESSPDDKGSLPVDARCCVGSGAEGRDCHRPAIAKAPIYTFTLVAIEASGLTRFYVATAGGYGPRTINAITAVLTGLRSCFGALLTGATNRPEIPTR
jgi:hypothetical protein